MENLFINIFQMSISASYLIAAVLLVRVLLRKAPKSMRSFLWLLVGIRLLVPFSVESVFSLVPDTKTVDSYIFEAEQAEMKTYTNTVGIYTPVSQPVRDDHAPSGERSAGRTRAAVLLCTRIWLLGMMLMLGYMLVSWLRLKKRVRMSVPVTVALECGQVKIYQSDILESPFLFGIIRPRIYFPSRTADSELPYVIRHEMAHQERRDHLVKPIGFVLLSVYWFNPCVWVAYIMLCKDIELICDEKVIKQLGVSCKKEYSQALLNSAVNRRMIAACPVAFGEVSVKERVKNVLNYKKPAFWVLVAAVLACIIVPVCFMTQKKAVASEIASGAVDTQETVNADEPDTVEINLDDVFSIAGEYEMINPDQKQYSAIPRLNLEEDGTFTFSYSMISSYLPYGTYELKDDILTAETEDGRYHYQFTRIGDFNNSILLFDTEHSSDVNDTDPKVNSDAPIENGSIFVKNTAAAALNDAQAAYQDFNQEFAQGTTMTVEEIHERQVKLAEHQNQLTMEEMKLRRQIEKADELLHNQEELAALEAECQRLIQEIENSVQQLAEAQETCQSVLQASNNTKAAYHAIEQWAQAFCDRDAGTIIQLADENVERQFADQDLLVQGDYYASFGWSSPWPWGDTAHNYHIVSVTDQSAEILYYAWTSDPHITVWREILTYETDNDECIITSEELHFMDYICTAEEFRQSYPDGIAGTMMDYYSINGAGESLNDNAKANQAHEAYAVLFAPDTAAFSLLNILNNPNKVGTSVTKSDTDADTCTVTFEFYEDGGTVDVQMIRPYGSDGIWLPHGSGSETSGTSDDTASAISRIITRSNLNDIVKEDATQLEALFPNHHEFAFDAKFPQMADLDGDGIEEKIEMINLLYNGGDGGYALRVTDTKTGEQIPLPDGYTEEYGFPVFSSYTAPDGDEQQLLIQLGEGKNCQTLAAIMQDALFYLYEQENLYFDAKNKFFSNEMISADALSGCNIVTFNNEKTPAILLKTYISGYAGHVDTLGYVITELRLRKDHTWDSRHYFLLDGCDYASVEQQNGSAKEGGGASVLPFDKKSEIDFLLLLPEEKIISALK